MLSKRTRLVTMVAAAVGIPYAWFNESISGPVRSSVSSLKSTLGAGSEPGSAAAFGNAWSATSSRSAAIGPIEPPHYHPLAEVVRFDITPRWVTEQWPRVSTVPSQTELLGFRVPLVTGIESWDVTGALTYYFDAQQKVRRLTLYGQTGDERQLVALAGQLGLKREPALAAGMLLSRWNGRPINVLRIRHAPVVRADAPTAKYAIELELNDPNSPFGLSPEIRQLIQHDANVNRWNGA